MKMILFVCTGNTCRSLMAEGLASLLLRQRGLEERYQVSSAGLAAYPYSCGSANALSVLADEGIDLAEHRAVQLNKELVNRADLILTMTASQKRRLLELYPEGRGRVYVLKEYADQESTGSSDQLAARLANLRAQRERFVADHGSRIKELEQERLNLMQRLQTIEDELGDWQRELDDEIQLPAQEVRRLELQLAGYDIADPYGQPLGIYQACAREMKTAIRAACNRLNKN